VVNVQKRHFYVYTSFKQGIWMFSFHNL